MSRSSVLIPSTKKHSEQLSPIAKSNITSNSDNNTLNDITGIIYDTNIIENSYYNAISQSYKNSGTNHNINSDIPPSNHCPSLEELLYYSTWSSKKKKEILPALNNILPYILSSGQHNPEYIIKDKTPSQKIIDYQNIRYKEIINGLDEKEFDNDIINKSNTINNKKAILDLEKELDKYKDNALTSPFSKKESLYRSNSRESVLQRSFSKENMITSRPTSSAFSPFARTNSALSRSHNFAENGLDNINGQEKNIKYPKSFSASSLMSNSNSNFPELLEMEDDDASVDYSSEIKDDLEDDRISPFPLHKQKSLYDRPSSAFVRSTSTNTNLYSNNNDNRPNTVDSKYLVASAPQMMERALSKSQSYSYGPLIPTSISTLKKPVRIGLSKSASTSCILDQNFRIVENLAKIKLAQVQVEKEEVSTRHSSVKDDPNSNPLLMGNPADLIKFDYVPHVVFTPAESAAEMAEKESLVKLSRSASASVLKNKLSIYRENVFARASLEKRVILIKSFAKFDDKGVRTERRPQTAGASSTGILERNKSSIVTTCKKSDELLSHRTSLKNSFEINKKRIMEEQEAHRLATLAKIEEKSILSKPKAMSSFKHGFLSSWIQLIVILKATRNMSEVFTSNKKIYEVIKNSRMIEDQKRDLIEENFRKSRINNYSADLISDFILFYRFGHRVDWRKLIMKFNLSGKVKRIQAWWRGQMFKITAAKILLEIFWLECEQSYCKSITVAPTAHAQNYDFNAPPEAASSVKFKRQKSTAVLSPTSPKHARNPSNSSASSFSTIKKSDFNFAGGARRGSILNTKKGAIVGDRTLFNKKRKVQVLENKRAELLKNFHDYLIEPSRRHLVINEYLTEKRRDYRIYLNRHHQQVKNWLTYNKEAIEVQKMKFALQSMGVPNIEEIKKILGCPQLKEFKILPTKEEMTDMIDFSFKKQKLSTITQTV